MAEAEEAFDDLGAPQSFEWTDGYDFDGGAAEGVTVSKDSNRSLQFGATTYTSAMPYRCVTSDRLTRPGS